MTLTVSVHIRVYIRDKLFFIKSYLKKLIWQWKLLMHIYICIKWYTFKHCYIKCIFLQMYKNDKRSNIFYKCVWYTTLKAILESWNLYRILPTDEYINAHLQTRSNPNSIIKFPSWSYNSWQQFIQFSKLIIWNIIKYE